MIGTSRSFSTPSLRGTVAGDRQVVWEGGGGRGIIAVVDFGDPKLHVNSRWRSWGVSTQLERRIPPVALRSDPVLAKRFSAQGMKSLQGLPKRLSQEEAAALDRLAGGLPAQRLPGRLPRAGEPVDDWFGSIDLDPEKTFELAVHTSRYLWQRIGFPEAPVVQQRLPSRTPRDPILIFDLLASGVVGELKRSLSPENGPGQIERYLARLEQSRPADSPWRGKLIHGDEVLSAAVRQRLDRTTAPIEVWAVVPAKVRRWKAIRQY